MLVRIFTVGQRDMKENSNTQRLYNDLAWLWPMWGGPEEYLKYCNHVAGLINEHAQIPVRTLLNIGCGGGKNVFHLKQNFDVTGLDLSPRMLSLARELNPECQFLQGDMRTFCLGRSFDAVLLDDAVSYMSRRADLTSILAHVPIRKLDPLERGFTLNQVLPVRLFPNPNRSDWTDSGNDHALLATPHACLLSRSVHSF